VVLFKDKKDLKFGVCPYCLPHRTEELRFDSGIIFCNSCGYAVRILGMSDPVITKVEGIEIKHPDFRLNKVHPHLYD